MRRYLVSGGAGFIGSHLVELLMRLGHKVVVLDNFSSGKLSNLPVDVQYLDWDISADCYDVAEEIKILEAVAGGKFDGVFHLAADARIQPTIKSPIHAIRANVIGTANVLEIMRHAGIKNIVYSGSSSTYGLKNKGPLKEEMKPDCLTPYAITKQTGEELCKVWSKCYGISSVCLKYFNVYGERSPIGLHAYSPVIGLFFKQILHDDTDVTVVGDGSQKRDFTYVKDVCLANVLAMKNLEHTGTANGETINIGTGQNYSLLSVAEKIINVCEPWRPHAKIRYIDARPGEAKETLADTTKAYELLKWQPMYELDATLMHTMLPYYMPKNLMYHPDYEPKTEKIWNAIDKRWEIFPKSPSGQPEKMYLPFENKWQWIKAVR